MTGALPSSSPSSHSHGAGDLPRTTTSAKGVVQLSSAVNSTSTTLAATASAVKPAYDLANSKWAYDEATIKAVKVNSAEQRIPLQLQEQSMVLLSTVLTTLQQPIGVQLGH